MQERCVYIALAGRLTSRFDDIVREMREVFQNDDFNPHEIKVSSFFCEDSDSIKMKIEKGVTAS